MWVVFALLAVALVASGVRRLKSILSVVLGREPRIDYQIGRGPGSEGQRIANR